MKNRVRRDDQRSRSLAGTEAPRRRARVSPAPQDAADSELLVSDGFLCATLGSSNKASDPRRGWLTNRLTARREPVAWVGAERSLKSARRTPAQSQTTKHRLRSPLDVLRAALSLRDRGANT